MVPEGSEEPATRVRLATAAADIGRGRQRIGVTRERVRQVEVKALRKLRHPSRSRELHDYLV